MNTYERAEIEAVSTKTKEDPAWWGILDDYLKKVKLSYFGAEYQDSIFQLFHQSRFDIYNAYSFMRVHSAMMSGEILSLRIHIGSTPFPDKAEAENNEILASLQYPFGAKFTGGLYLNDGYFEWAETLEFGQKLLCDGTEYKRQVPPACVPLEVGYTKPSTTLFHIMESGALARWPYGSEWIHLFSSTKTLGEYRAHKLFAPKNY